MATCLLFPNFQTSENVKQHTVMEEQARELARLHSQVAQLRTRVLDQTHDHDLEAKSLQTQLDGERKKFIRDLQEERSDNLAERKKRDVQGACLASFKQECLLPQRAHLTNTPFAFLSLLCCLLTTLMASALLLLLFFFFWTHPHGKNICVFG